MAMSARYNAATIKNARVIPSPSASAPSTNGNTKMAVPLARVQREPASASNGLAHWTAIARMTG